MRRVRIVLIGEGAAWISGTEILVPRVFATIIGFLLTQPKFSASRDRLASALWPTSTDAAARHTLSSALYRTRAALPECERLIACTGERFALTPCAARSIDLVAYERHLDRLFAAPAAAGRSWRRRVGAMLATATGSLLHGIDEEWAAMARERWRCRRLDALVMLADLAAREGDWSNVVLLGREVCAAEPLREDAQRLFIEALAHSGNRALALRQFEVCARILREELDVAPMAETRALVRRLRLDAETAGNDIAPLRDALLATRRQLRSTLDHVENVLTRY